jgi:hypothetical protein
MAKKKMTRDIPLPSSDGMFGGIKGRSLKAATPGIPTATIKTFRNIGDYDINYNSKKVPADRTGRAMGDFQMMIMLMKFLRVGGILVVADTKMT